MKDLSKFAEDVLRVLTNKVTLTLIGILGATAGLRVMDRSAEVFYRSLPRQEASALQEHDTGIKGVYTQKEMRNLLEDYHLTPKNNNIREVKYVPTNNFAD